ncbi:CHAT domain-containing protein [Ephemerocybe angulata]|uniref:CHAT domain-containing protein n=1 Tax=Ephemerocybe angulata TaxID=980116 RepID=A0A8H6I0N1_9AGAR|nr:CHAT domain-containing protein [Tulosesus angulatus]
MAQQNSLLIADKALERSHVLMINSIEAPGMPLSLTELCIFEAQASEQEQAKSFALVNTSPGCWAATDACFETTVTCIVKSDDGQDIGLIHLDVEETADGHSRAIELCDGDVQITMLWKCLDITSNQGDGSDDVAELFNHRGLDCFEEFQATGELSTLQDAIFMLLQAVNLTAPGHTNLPSRVNNLASLLAKRFERTGELSDMAHAIQLQQMVVDQIPKGHDDLPGYLGNLGSSFTLRFQRMGDPLDLSRAISMQQNAVDLTPVGDAALPTYLTNLGGALARRFEQTGEISDISQAISVQQRAVEATTQGSSKLRARLNNLGHSFTCRFQRTGELSDIAEAIALHDRAVHLTSRGHSDLPIHLDNLGGALIHRFKRTSDLSDLSRAIEAGQRAVDATPQGSTDLPARYSNLGHSYTARFEQTGDIADIDGAILMQQRALKLTPAGHNDLPTYLSNNGVSLSCRFVRTGSLSDITDAISLHRQAVDLTPYGHAELPSRLKSLATSLADRFTSTAETEDLKSSISYYKAAATATVGPPRTRMDAAKRWARILIQQYPQSPDVIDAFDRALALVASIAGLEKTVGGRYTQLKGISGLALEAAATACALNRADKALEWLEQGRCLVWSQINSLRTPLDNLRRRDENLAQALEDVSRALERAGASRAQAHVDMPLSQKISVEDEARAHLDLARKWDELLKTARAIPGFESFLMQSPCSTVMQNLPESGPIIVINVDANRCDALALLSGLDEPLHIPLPNFSMEKASRYRTELGSQLRGHSLRSRDLEARGVRPTRIGNQTWDSPVHKVLRGLWKEVVKPILDALGFSKVDEAAEKVPPRLWWCPTGPLSFLPLHAAGIYRGSDQDSVLNYVVSSYSPTVTSLTDRVKNDRSHSSTAQGLFLTSQPSVPGAPPIPGTTKEMEGDDITVEECLERMKEFGCIHLACHGSQNAAEPLRSRFLFHQGSLELGTILQSNLMHADLAFLSACQTSTGQETLSDEAVHLAAGMLAAGYRRVVGTMWSIGDQPAEEVATSFYEYLLDSIAVSSSSTIIIDDTFDTLSMIPPPTRAPVIYVGYKLPLAQFKDMMDEIPSYKALRELEFDGIPDEFVPSVYARWRRKLPPTLRSRAPQILGYWRDDESHSGPCDDVMCLLRYTTYKGEEQYRNPDHPDAFKFRVEKDSDVRCRDAFIRFFRSQGVTSVTAVDFTYAFVAGKHPKDRVPY